VKWGHGHHFLLVSCKRTIWGWDEKPIISRCSVTSLLPTRVVQTLKKGSLIQKFMEILAQFPWNLNRELQLLCLTVNLCLLGPLAQSIEPKSANSNVWGLVSNFVHSKWNQDNFQNWQLLRSSWKKIIVRENLRSRWKFTQSFSSKSREKKTNDWQQNTILFLIWNFWVCGKKDPP